MQNKANLFTFCSMGWMKSPFLCNQEKNIFYQHLSSLWRSIQIFSNVILSNDAQSIEGPEHLWICRIYIVQSIDLLNLFICEDKNI